MEDELSHPQPLPNERNEDDPSGGEETDTLPSKMKHKYAYQISPEVLLHFL